MPIRTLPGKKDGDSTVDLTTLLAAGGDLGTPKGVDPAPEELMFITEGLPPIPSKVVKKVEKGEFVDFADLLPKKPGVDEPSYSELAKEGIIVVTENRHIKGQKKAIKDISSWIEAFLAFAAIRNRKHPNHTNDLLAYGALVARGARDYKGLGWLSYDFQFRRLAAARGNLGNWGQKDVSLWNETVCKPPPDQDQQKQAQGSEGHTEEKGTKRKMNFPQASNPLKRSRSGKEKQWRSLVCYQFSYGGKCSRDKCEFLHICYECGGTHAQSSCPNKKDN